MRESCPLPGGRTAQNVSSFLLFNEQCLCCKKVRVAEMTRGQCWNLDGAGRVPGLSGDHDFAMDGEVSSHVRVILPRARGFSGGGGREGGGYMYADVTCRF